MSMFSAPVPVKIPKEFNDRLVKWKNQAREQGFNVSKVHILRVMAHNMKDYDFKSDSNVFKQRDVFDSFRTHKRRSRK